MNETKEALLEMQPREAAVMAALVVAVMGITMIHFGWVPHLSVILVLCGLLCFGKAKGLDFGRMQLSMARGVLSGIGAIYLFFFIGLLVSALMVSGAIPTLMYYGFELISPQFFYLSAKRFSNSLMPQAYSQHGSGCSIMPDYFRHQTRFRWDSRAWTQHNSVVFLYFFQGKRIIVLHCNFRS